MNENDYNDGYIDPTFVFAFSAVVLAITFIILVARWRVYQKAGQPGWASLIPVYNFYVLLKIVGKR